MTYTKPLTCSDTEHSVFGQSAYLPAAIIPLEKDIFRSYCYINKKGKVLGKCSQIVGKAIDLDRRYSDIFLK